jgi:hypothetical protein
MLFARLEPFPFDLGDFVSFLIPYERDWSVGIAAAGIAGDLDDNRIFHYEISVNFLCFFGGGKVVQTPC